MSDTQPDTLSDTELDTTVPEISRSPSSSSLGSGKGPWGRLVSLNPVYPNIDLYEDEVILGRSGSTCKMTYEDPTISGRHCRIYRDPTPITSKTGNVVFVVDMSTNGTFINGELLGRGKKLLLQNGVDVALTPKKHPEKIAYIYQDCKEEEREELEGGPQRTYDLRDVLGTGNFATVRLAVHRDTGERFAMKIVDKKKLMIGSQRPEALMDEVNVLSRLKHPNITSIKDIFQTESTMYLVLELVTGGELFDRIVKEGRFSEDRCRFFLVQMLSAVQYLHTIGIAHRDLKPENILLADNTSDHIKISDFGLSRILDEGSFMKTMCGTPQYVAPEVLTHAEKGGYGKAVDLWSIGVIMYILLCGFAPFEETGDTPLLDKVQQGKYRFPSPQWDTISNDAKDLIKHLLVVDPTVRYTVDQACEHPWVRDRWAQYKEERAAEELKDNSSSTDSTTTTATSSTSTSSSSDSSDSTSSISNSSEKSEDSDHTKSEGKRKREAPSSPEHADPITKKSASQLAKQKQDSVTTNEQE
eukprot:TRINITY_DN2323_c1_g2_i2.p1 TRINITY_DN2323_c1_g2~~TRINITY_DN2323_c1_g2_i2.p1  ORF type:complete len:544 (+),score=139.32 TRINITY_DN2323_c1_g2_i2:49-1632(+)